MMPAARRLLFCAVIAGAPSGAPSPAHAACYEIIGCTDGDRYRQADLARFSCQILAEIRNGIFAENGYCFRKLKWQRQFGNKGCRFTQVSAVPLSRIERANVGAIRRAERLKGCAAD
jgi:hypothetical protein